MILKTDREKLKLPVVEPTIEAPKKDEPKVVMGPSKGGDGTWTQKQMITTIVVIVVIVIVIVVAVYFYNKNKKAPLTIQ